MENPNFERTTISAIYGIFTEYLLDIPQHE